MENSSLITANCSAVDLATCNSSEFYVEPLPLGAVAFAPLFFIEMVAAFVSNAILLALVIFVCMHKSNNNINIYLFSVSVSGLFGAFNTFCALTLVVARRWVLGGVLCVLNTYTFLMANSLYLALYLFISLDKYKVVKNSFLSRPSKKRAYVLSVVTWIVTFAILVLGSFQSIRNRLHPVEKDNFLCFGISSQSIESHTRFIFETVLVVGYCIISIIVIAMSFINYVRILFELRKLNKLRKQFSVQSHHNGVLRINQQDRPLFIAGEERTAKSLALVFFIQFTALSISYGMSYVQIIRNFVLPLNDRDTQDFDIYFLVIIMAQLFPSTNPVYLILSNKRLRMRVRGLFKCELNQNTGEDSPVHTNVTATAETVNDTTRQATKKSPKFRFLSKLHANSRVFPQPV